MRIPILKGLIDVLFTINDRRTRDRAHRCTDAMIQRHVPVRWTIWHNLSTWEVSSMKLIRHQRFKRICQRIYVPHPTGPPRHVGVRDGKTSVYHDAYGEKRAWNHCLMGGARDTRQGAIDSGHNQGGDIGGQTEEEKGTVLATKIRHKVDDCVEYNHVACLVRNIYQIASDGLGRLVIEGVSILFLDSWTLGVQC